MALIFGAVNNNDMKSYIMSLILEIDHFLINYSWIVTLCQTSFSNKGTKKNLGIEDNIGPAREIMTSNYQIDVFLITYSWLIKQSLIGFSLIDKIGILAHIQHIHWMFSSEGLFISCLISSIYDLSFFSRMSFTAHWSDTLQYCCFTRGVPILVVAWFLLIPLLWSKTANCVLAVKFQRQWITPSY